MPEISLKLIGFGLLFLAFFYLIWDRQALKADIADQQTTITKLSDANDQFVAAAEKQNAATKEADRLHQQSIDKYEAALKAATASEKDHQKSESAILVDKVKGDHCLYVHNMFTQYMRGRHP